MKLTYGQIVIVSAMPRRDVPEELRPPLILYHRPSWPVPMVDDLRRATYRQISLRAGFMVESVKTKESSPMSASKIKSAATQYQHLESRPGSNYRQMFLKGRRIRAAVVDETVNGPDPCTAEEFARDFHVPLEAVKEAIDYVARNRLLIEQERDEEAADVKARGLDRP